LATLIFCALLHPTGPVFAQSVDLRSAALVRQDSSDCTNADVSASDTSLVGGTVAVERRPDGSGRVRVSLGAQPNTTYRFFLKCVRQLGDLTTDTDGFGSGDFRFQAGATGDVFAFDVSPEGAPAGNVYQSVQVNLRVPPPVVEVAPHIEYVRQVGGSVSFFYEGMPAGSEVAVVNSTLGSSTVVSTYPLSSVSAVSSDIMITGEGVYYLLARSQADKNYIAQTIEFYVP
jgi:hypothetical protein